MVGRQKHKDLCSPCKLGLLSATVLLEQRLELKDPQIGFTADRRAATRFENVGEDAMSFFGNSSANLAFTVRGGGAKNAADKVIQFNGRGTVVSESDMRCKPKVSCSYLVMPWWMMLALLLLLIDESSSAPIPQSASELMGDDEKALIVGPGRPEDNAVLVVNDSNKLSFTMFRPSCLGSKESLKEVSAEISLGDSCKMNITWVQITAGETIFNIARGNLSLNNPGLDVQVNLDGIRAKYSSGEQSGGAPCMLNLRKVPDGNGYLANISLRGTPECEVKALFNYKQYEPLSSGNPESLPSDSLSTPSIVGISVGVVEGKEDEKKKAQPVGPKKEEQKQKQLVGGTCQRGQKKPSKTTQPVPPKQSNQGKNKSAEPVAIVIEPPEEEVLKPKSQPKQVLEPKSQPKQVIKPKSKLKQVIKPSVSEEMPKSLPMPKGVPVGYRPEDCVWAVSPEKSLSPNPDTNKEIAKVQECSKSIQDGDLVGTGLKAEMAGTTCIGQDSLISMSPDASLSE
uniref:pectate lyase n=1 Tax=Ditylenchus dipsaci TaxID=166011 RepID=A0A915D2M3_9BILA